MHPVDLHGSKPVQQLIQANQPISVGFLILLFFSFLFFRVGGGARSAEFGFRDENGAEWYRSVFGISDLGFKVQGLGAKP